MISTPGTSRRILDWTFGGAPEGSAEVLVGTPGVIQKRFQRGSWMDEVPENKSRNSFRMNSGRSSRRNPKRISR